MKYLLLFYSTFSFGLGFFSLAVLILAYLKSGWKALKYIVYLLLAWAFQLLFLTYVENRYSYIPIWLNANYGIINYGLESFAIIILPILINELFNPAWRKRINSIFGVLFFSGLICIIISFSESISSHGVSIETFFSYKIYRMIYITAYIYSFFVFIFKIKDVSNGSEKKFYIYAAAILLILAFQTIPVIQSLPGRLFILASGHFYLNMLLLKYLMNRFFNFTPPILKETLGELITGREKEILLLLMQGLANKDIGARLCISEPTVKSHVQNIYKKLGVNNRIQLINSCKKYFDFSEMIAESNENTQQTP